MTAAVVGTVLSLGTGTVFTIQDNSNRETIECTAQTDDILDLKVGMTAIFVGQYSPTEFKVRKIEIRKFLDPLYEEDLLSVSNSFALVPVMNNPFTEAYLEWQKNYVEEETTEEPSNDSVSEEDLEEEDY